MCNCIANWPVARKFLNGGAFLYEIADLLANFAFAGHLLLIRGIFKQSSGLLQKLWTFDLKGDVSEPIEHPIPWLRACTTSSYVHACIIMLMHPPML